MNNLWSQKIETAFVAYLAKRAAFGGYTVRPSSSDEEIKYPALVITARETGDCPELKYGGVYGKFVDLSFSITLNADGKNSADEIERAAELVKRTVENATDLPLQCSHFVIDFQGVDRSFTDNKRSVKLTWQCQAI